MSGTVLWYTEENREDAAVRLKRHGADLSKVHIRWHLERPPLDQLEDDLRALQPTLVIIDSLAWFVRDLELKSGDSDAWAPLIYGLAELTRRYEAATVFAHHADKAKGEYRDSTAIGAAVDMICTLRAKDAGVRRVEAKGKRQMGPFEYALAGSEKSPRLELLGEALSLEERVRRYVENNPGCTTSAVRREVTGDTSRIPAILGDLEGAGFIRNEGQGRGNAWTPTNGQPFLSEARENGEERDENG